MTREEEAIERLKTDIYKYADFTENPNENEFWMAFDMAIKSLEQIEKIKSIINDPFYFRDMPDYLLRYKAICEVLKEAEHDQRRRNHDSEK